MMTLRIICMLKRGNERLMDHPYDGGPIYDTDDDINNDPTLPFLSYD